ncbi:MAG: hypothetical protein P1U56_10370 [Saprospiraceae bacterium]|nr:hypothetical protein [Saprospiraceae bacterium]
MKHLLYLLIAFGSIHFASCGDEATGCTDPNAANYDPEAEVDSGNCTYPGCTDEDADNYDVANNQDDGTCTYFDLYLGTYSGNFMCASTFADLLDEASANITKKQGDENTNEITVIVSNPATEITLLLDATISKEEVVIDTYIQNFEYSLEVGPLVVEGPFEVFVTGTLTRSEDGTLTGPVSIRIDKTDLALSVSDVCDYTATKN